MAREPASHLRLKQHELYRDRRCWRCGAGTGFSSEIETPMIFHCPGQGRSRGAGTGFSSEIETCLFCNNSWASSMVAREPASHLRLKLFIHRLALNNSRCGAGTGFSSEIETQSFSLAHRQGTLVAREPASHLRLKRYVSSGTRVSPACGAGTGFSSEIETKGRPCSCYQEA